MTSSLTVGIPCYNCGETIEKTLQSINIQTLKPHEVLIVDDCSTENYETIFSKFPEINIRHIRLNKNQGVGYVRSKIVDETKTKYLTMIDSDDYFFHVNVIWFFQNSIESEDFDFLTTVFVREEEDKSQVVPDNQNATCHSKLYNVGFMKKNKINFPAINAFEEGSVNRILYKTGKCLQSNNRTYFWTYNKKGLTKKEDMLYERFIDYCKSFLEQKKHIEISEEDISGIKLELFMLKQNYGSTEKIQEYEKFVKENFS